MSNVTNKDYYAVLEVSETATTEEIRKAFQKKAVKLHPDVNKEPDAEERFKEVSEAYAVLSDPDKRAHYDQMRKNPFASAQSSSSAGYGYYGTGGNPFGSGFPFGGAWSTRTSTTRSRSYNPKAGADFVFQMQLSDQEAKEGVRRAVTYQRYTVCDNCNGTGSSTSSEPTTCPMCNGAGHISVDIGSLLGIGVLNVVCPECEGTGKVVSTPCEVCSGSGRVLSATEQIIEVPANSHDGDAVRLEGKGNAGTNGSEAGDFVARICVPSEQLDRRQTVGFRTLGFALPFLLLSLISAGFSIITVILFVVGLFFIITSDLKGRRGYWWRSAAYTVVSGISSALPLIVFFFMLSMCNGIIFRT